MDKIVIKVENLGKLYRIGSAAKSNQTLREVISDRVTSLFPQIKTAHKLVDPSINIRADHIWALRNVCFDIKQGEVVGIIGRNGTGKSTLLKILSRITDPTEGRVVLKGRVGSLLEVGTGFHSELTGEENVYLSGTILGMSSHEISRKFAEIVDFAEMDKFIHTPVKYYSSGMFMRLAFAVAAHLEPEILLVDEVLAVGDAEFQAKCLGKMGSIASEGRTVLFVSHNMVAVQQLCQRGIVLENGQISYTGSAADAVSMYFKGSKEIKAISLMDRTDRKGNQRLQFTEVGIYNEDGDEIHNILSGEDISIRFYYTSNEALSNASVNIAFNVRNEQGCLLTNLNSVDSGFDRFLDIYPHGYFQCKWSDFSLRSGTYDCALFCSINGDIADWIQSAFTLQVKDGDFFHTGKLTNRNQGDVLITHSWSGK
jgi:lipopolysaccharide transport system ATP-binding protein